VRFDTRFRSCIYYLSSLHIRTGVCVRRYIGLYSNSVVADYPGSNLCYHYIIQCLFFSHRVPESSCLAWLRFGFDFENYFGELAAQLIHVPQRIRSKVVVALQSVTVVSESGKYTGVLFGFRTRWLDELEQCIRSSDFLRFV
jgi:hypothetical protein